LSITNLGDMSTGDGGDFIPTGFRSGLNPRSDFNLDPSPTETPLLVFGREFDPVVLFSKKSQKMSNNNYELGLGKL
jgi:hypothetical protein